MRSAAVVGLTVCLQSRLFLRSLPPRRAFLSADLPSVTASLRRTAAGKLPNGLIRRVDVCSGRENKPADGLVSRWGTWKPGPAEGAGRRPRRPLVLTQKTAPTAGLLVN
ncbi:Hypothetical predicted protein [Xyrichtys novacula]|uniref:Secreted protein n=1 Tax=Xyrichtys novacula TaxID=13765 RepID=A0AAV1H975_XYRNO|nr:Hypothetical predicted protein [Xyrichtys novacula]